MTDNPFDLFRENTPLTDLPTDSIDEFLDRIIEDQAAGMVEHITDERLEKLILLFREEAIQWEIKQREKPVRGAKKKSFTNALQIDITL